jgi:hypothetical protein
MVDAVAVFPPGYRFIDGSGTLYASGRVEFFQANTTNPLTVYSDSDLSVALGSTVYLDGGAYPVSGSGSSTKVQVYTGTDPYKIILYNSTGADVLTVNPIQGAFNSAAILETLTIIAETEVETLTTDTTLDANDLGQLKNLNTTGGAFTVTLPDATALSNGARFGFRMAGTANAAKIKTTSTQTIGRSGVASTAVSLTNLGETVWLVNDGGNWLMDTYVPPLMSTFGVIKITDRLTAPPGSEPAGARFIMSGSPSGDWSPYAQHDIVETDGQGGFFRYTPAEDCGWIAYVADENAYYFFVGTAWSLLGASDTAPGLIEIATQAEQETGTDLTRAVVSGRQHFHPSAAKAWGVVTYSGGTPTLQTSFNISGITDQGTGDLTVTFDVDFSSVNYVVVAWSESDSTAQLQTSVLRQGTKAAGSFRLQNSTYADNSKDPPSISFVCFGDQP